jgi:Fe-S-cluster containining protein
MIRRLLKSWQQQIPAMSCIPGCRDCCEGYAPSMTLGEWREIRHPGKIVKGMKVFGACPFLGASGCEIYARRPLICRIFGTVGRDELEKNNLAVTLPVCCPRGCQPETPWPLKEALAVQVHYHKWLNRDLLAVTADFRAYQRWVGRDASLNKPAKFEWLYYVLCTRDGQNNLRQLYGQGRPALAPEELGRLAAIMGG